LAGDAVTDTEDPSGKWGSWDAKLFKGITSNRALARRSRRYSLAAEVSLDRKSGKNKSSAQADDVSVGIDIYMVCRRIFS